MQNLLRRWQLPIVLAANNVRPPQIQMLIKINVHFTIWHHHVTESLRGVQWLLP